MNSKPNVNNDFVQDEELLKEFDQLIAKMKDGLEALQKSDIVVNEHRMEQFQFAYASLCRIFKDDDDVEISYEMFTIRKTMGSIRAEGGTIELSNTRLFAHALEFADNVDIYPLANGRVRFELTFHKLATSVLAQNN